MNLLFFIGLNADEITPKKKDNKTGKKKKGGKESRRNQSKSIHTHTRTHTSTKRYDIYLDIRWKSTEERKKKMIPVTTTTVNFTLRKKSVVALSGQSVESFYRTNWSVNVADQDAEMDRIRINGERERECGTGEREKWVERRE